MLKYLICLFVLCTSLMLNGTVVDILGQLQQMSEVSKSDAVIILRESKPLFIYHSDIPSRELDTLEITNSLLGLAIAFLREEGNLACLDIPISSYYPQCTKEPWNQMTIRHLLNNTSGIDNDATTNANSKNAIDEILTSTSLFDPGMRFNGNTNSLILLIDIVKQATGKCFEDYLFQKLFCPLGIENVTWNCSEIGDLMPHVWISAWDVAKIGSMIANKGMYCNKRIISERSLQELFFPSQDFEPSFGFQWWLEFYDVACWWDEELINAYKSSNMNGRIIENLEALQGRVLHFEGQICGTESIFQGKEWDQIIGDAAASKAFIQGVRNQGLPLCRFENGKVKSIRTQGQGGQLIIMPQDKLVGVVQQQANSKDSLSINPFQDLSKIMEALAKECNAYID